MSENLHVGHRDRLKNRYLNEGLESFEQHEILELMLYPHIPMKDTNPIAHELLLRYGSLSAVLEAHPEDLVTVNNMTKAAALYLSLAKDVFKAYQKDKIKSKTTILNRSSAINYLYPLLAHNTIEEAILICLNIKHKIIKTTTLARGDENKCNITVKHIVELVLRHKATFVILAHNHPSSNPEPSIDDISFTRSCCLILKMLGITLIDHFIIGGEEYYSFDEKGYLERFRQESNKLTLLQIAEKMETEKLL